MKYPTSILCCPTGVYIVVGSVPSELVGKCWQTRQEAVDALSALGIIAE